MAWPTETIIALITLLVAGLPLLIKAWFYAKRKLKRRTPGTDLLPLHRPPSHLAPRTITEHDMDIPGLLINLNQLERSIDMQILMSQQNLATTTSNPLSDNSLNALRRITAGLSTISV